MNLFYQKPLELTIKIFILNRVNQMLRERSDQTAAIFIYLPKPPRIDSPNWSDTSLQYLELLTELTADLPPTVINKLVIFFKIY